MTSDRIEPPFISPMFVCADCGRTLTLRRGKWAHVEPDDDGWGVRGDRYVFTCRTHTRTEADDRIVLEAADYHYVAGEQQRHFDRSSIG